MNLKGTETEKNLLRAFAGESQASTKYTLFEETAKTEGYEQIAALFKETADNEKEHAKIFFNFLGGGNLEITAGYPAGKLGSTIENLKSAADGEHEEFNSIYPSFADIARKEGFNDIAAKFDQIAKIEFEHEKRFKALHQNMVDTQVFKRNTEQTWQCRACGHEHIGTNSPTICPVCSSAQAYQQIKPHNY